MPNPSGPGLPLQITPTGATQLSTTKFSLPQPFSIASPTAATFSVDEEDHGWWGGVQQAGAFVALAFALEASVLSGNTAVAFQAQHQDEIARGVVIEEVYSFQDQKSLPPLESDYPAYISPHQDEISRGVVVDEIYEYKASPSIEPILLPSPYWFDPNEISRGSVIDEVYDYRTASSIDSIMFLFPYWFDSNEMAISAGSFQQFVIWIQEDDA